MKKKVLITGCAGFIGYSLCNLLLKKKYNIVGIDSLNSYYNLNLKKKRINLLKSKNFKFIKCDISKKQTFFKYIKNYNFNFIIHLAAQPGVRYSFENPQSYIHNNVDAFANILEYTRLKKIDLFYASSSSVYGECKSFPINENSILRPNNIYALTKKHNEEMATLYSKLYKLRIFGLRFFTVYGEWGRPDMFIIKFFESIRMNKYFPIFNNGNHYRDFTYIGDVIKMVFELLKKRKKFNKEHKIFNVCRGKSIFIKKVLKYLVNLTKFRKIKNVKLKKTETFKTHGSNKRINKISKIKNFKDIYFGIQRTYYWYQSNKKLFD